MVRKEPKLRPSNSWAELELMIKAADFYIQHCIATNTVNLETVKLAEVKKYFESFKPANAISAIEAFAAKYGIAVNPDNIQAELSKESVTSEVVAIAQDQVSPLDIPDITDDQRYDILKLRKESTYSEDERAFMLNVGTMIMMRRASIKPVNSEDL